jgi:hypothetical protein
MQEYEMQGVWFTGRSHKSIPHILFISIASVSSYLIDLHHYRLAFLGGPADPIDDLRHRLFTAHKIKNPELFSA